MARDGSGVYSLPANTLAVSGDPISSTKFNSLVQDVEADLNVDRPITAGGTGSSTALGALTNLFSGASPGGADKIAFWDQSATSFGWLSLGTGLTFSGTTLALDADLATLAGLTPTANNFIVGNAGGTAWEVKTPADSRTALGLGTAAVVNTGTSGATIPLLNGTNTWSGPQTLSATAPTYAFIDTDAATDTGRLRFSFDSGVFALQALTDAGAFGATAWRVLRTGTTIDEFEVNATVIDINGTADFSVAPTVGGSNTVWHAGNDGAGSGLDADTLDGVQGSAYATLAAGQTFTALKQFQAAAEATDAARVINSATSRRLHLYSGKVGSQNGDLDLDAEDGNTVNLKTSGTSRATFNATQATFLVPAQIRPSASAETTGTLTSSSSNKTIQATGDITIDNSVFAAGDIILIYAGDTSRTITQGSGVTMRLGGSATTGSRTLAARGVAMLFFVSASEVVVSGSGVT